MTSELSWRGTGGYLRVQIQERKKRSVQTERLEEESNLPILLLYSLNRERLI